MTEAEIRAKLKSIDWRYNSSRLILTTIGSVLLALAIIVFLMPADLVPAGTSGIAVILKNLIGTPIGIVIILLNIPIQILAYRQLNGWRTIAQTVYTVVLYSLLLDVMDSLITIGQVSDDLMLNALFGGILSGIGGGLVYRSGGTTGGTATLARMLRKQWGISIQNASLYTDGGILIAAGAVFGIEAALYSTIALFVGRLVSNYVLMGESNTNTALIISRQAAAVAEAIRRNLGHEVTCWNATSADQRRQDATMLFVSLYQSEMYTLRKLLELVDSDAFITVLQAQKTYGGDFEKIRPHLPLHLDAVEDDGMIGLEVDNLPGMDGSEAPLADKRETQPRRRIA